MKKLTCSVLALLMAISPFSVFALTDANSPIIPSGDTPVTLNTTPLTFNATVPTGLPLDLAANGVVTPATEASIINNSIGPIKVVSITTEAAGTWTLTNYTDNFSTKKVNSKDIALQLNQDNVQSSGGIALTPQNWPTIAGNGSLKLDYQGKLAPQSEGFTKATAAYVSFVLDWDSSVSTPEGLVDVGDKYVDGNYEYSYGQTYIIYENSWENSSLEGWGVRVIDKTPTTYVQPLEEVHGEPVVSYMNMFSRYPNTTLVLDGEWTNKNITDMRNMFFVSKATTVDLNNFDTSNVTDMSNMFESIWATTLDLSNFDTSNVTNMSWMFSGSDATTLDLSNLDTSKVTDMSYMFSHSQATTLDLSNFDTSNVTNMQSMFSYSQATTLDVSNFNTSNVTDMRSMFASSQATTLDASNFNTSNVTDMSYMFNSSSATTLDLSNFDTFNVTDMSWMFYGSQATTLDLSNFDTSSVTNMSNMFGSNQVTTLDLSSFNTTNVTDMNEMFAYSDATTGYARTQTDADNFNASSNKPAALTFRVK